MGFVQFNGPPGETWENDSGKVKYQFRAEWQNTCGVCAGYDGAIGDSWPIPLHRNCRCKQILIFPGGRSQPFTDFRRKIRGLDPAQQSRVVGAANLQLIERGVVKWEDVVTEGRIRDLREVVSLKQLTVKQMTKVGVPKPTAEQAYKSVNTAAHEIANESRRRLIEALKAKGVSNERIKRLVGERLAARASIGAGPSGPQELPIEFTPLPLTTLETMLGIRFTEEARKIVEEEPVDEEPVDEEEDDTE